MTRTDIDHLTNEETGRYCVNTFASSYEIDFDNRTIQRHSTKNALRGDDKPVALDYIVRCVVGMSARFVLSGLAERGETERTTTVVLSIEEM